MTAFAVASLALARLGARDALPPRPRATAAPTRRARVGKPAKASAGAEPSSSASARRPLRMIVLRHSDSCTEDASLKDHDRPLTAWGRSAAAALCERVVDAEWADPDLVLCSASTRSRETLAAMQAVHAPLRDATTVFMGSLYAVAVMDGVTADHLKETIVEWAEKAENETAADGVTARAVRTVLCVGHNKGWEEAAGDFTGERVSLKVANAALIECASDDDGYLTWAKAFDENASGWTLRAVLTHGLPDPGACEAGPGDGGGQSGGPGDDGSGDEAWGEGAPFPA